MPTPAPILVNSLPKSGTHLLSRAVELLGHREHFTAESELDPRCDPPAFLSYRRVLTTLAAQGDRPLAAGEGGIAIGTQVPVFVSPARLARWLDGVGAGRFILGHLERDRRLSDLLAERGLHHVFIIREPGAVLASLLDFVLDTRGMGPHFLAPECEARTQGERLALLLDGGDAPRIGLRVRPFAGIYRRMLAWQTDPRCLVVRFEALVGPVGGGDVDLQRATVERLARHLGRPGGALNVPVDGVFDRAARTFRQGRTDGWRRRLPPELVARVDAYVAPLRALAGYDRAGRYVPPGDGAACGLPAVARDGSIRALPMNPDSTLSPQPEPITRRLRMASLSDKTWSGRVEHGHFDALDARARSAGIAPDDSLVFVCPHTARAAVVLLWLLDRGRDVVLLPPDQGEVVPELTFCRAVLRVVEGEPSDAWSDVQLAPNPGFTAARVRRAGHAPRLYVRTSGSMGRSKLVCWTHDALLANAAACVERFGLTAADRVIIPVPITHMYGLGAGFLPSVLANAACDLVTRANLVRYLDRERAFEPDVAFLTPALCEMMVRRRRADRPHRQVVTAGARIEPSVFRAFDARFGPLVNLYGSSELGAVAAHRIDDSIERRAEALGDPLDGMALTVRDDGTAGRTGELMCRAEHGFAGYVDCDGADLSAAPAAFPTRDRVRLLDDGTLRVLGRMDNAVNRDGRLVMFADIERALEGLDEVREAVVVRAVGDTMRGPRLAAWCVPHDDRAGEAVRKAARAALPPHALPETFATLDALPRLPSGKVDRQALIKMTTDGQRAAT